MFQESSSNKKFQFRQTNKNGKKKNIIMSVLKLIPRLIRRLIDLIKKKFGKSKSSSSSSMLSWVRHRHFCCPEYMFLIMCVALSPSSWCVFLNPTSSSSCVLSWVHHDDLAFSYYFISCYTRSRYAECFVLSNNPSNATL